MKKNILTFALVVISFIPTYFAIYISDITLATLTELEKLSRYEEPKAPSRTDRVIAQYDLLSKIDNEASKQLGTMSLYEKHLMSKIYEKRKADPFSFNSSRTIITNLINEDEPCDIVNIKKRLECEESRNNEISKTVEKFSNIHTISKYKHKALTDTIEAILLETNESIWIKLGMENNSNEQVYSDNAKTIDLFLILFSVCLSMACSLMLTENLKRNDVEGGEIR